MNFIKKINLLGLFQNKTNKTLSIDVIQQKCFLKAEATVLVQILYKLEDS